MIDIRDSAYADDDGAAHPAVTSALAAYADDRGLLPETLDVVQRSRLLVPVVAVLGDVEYDDQGLAHDKTSDMATVLVQGADGRMALLAFSGTEAMQRWNPQARPVPVSAGTPRRSAQHDAAAALVVDIAGPVTLVVEGDDLEGFAQGGGSRGWATQAPGCRRRTSPDLHGLGRSREDPLIFQRSTASGDHGTTGFAPHRSLQVVGSGPRDSVSPSRGGPSPRLPQAIRGSLSQLEDLSAPSCASTTGFGFPRSGSSDPTARRSASCRPTRH